MKHTFLLFVFLVCFSASFAQQYLWTTQDGDAADSKFQKHIALNDAPAAVLEFYDQYNRYYDMAGYSKETFIKTVDYGFKDWAWLNDVHELTVSAVRINDGQGSVVIVLCVSRDNVNMLAFANNPIKGNSNYILTIPGQTQKDKFTRWFRTLLN